MREIKFRLHDKDGVVIGYENHVVNEFGCWQILQNSLRGDFLDTDTMNVREGFFIAATYKYQFTGLKDKNGNDIYESDIIETKYGEILIANDFNSFIYEILYSESHSGLYGISRSDIKVIGNIYENPELICKAEKN